MPDLERRTLPFSDAALSRRLERAEGESCARFAEARARLLPESGSEWIEVAGATVVFDGVTSPVTQTFGLGLFEPATAVALERIERFFGERGAPVFHEVSPMAEPAVLTLLGERGYRPIELTSVLVRPLGDDLSLGVAVDPGIRVREIEAGEEDLWSRVSARGWSESPELADFLREVGRITAEREGTHAFFAELEGEPIATGVLSLHGGVAHLAGACTVPEGRRRGAQLALLEARLRWAAERGCDLALMGTLPGSGSQRNAERHGFRIVYTRLKWQLATAAA